MTQNGTHVCNTLDPTPDGAVNPAGVMGMSLNNYAPGTYNVTVQWSLLVSTTCAAGGVVSGGAAVKVTAGARTQLILNTNCNGFPGVGPGSPLVIMATTVFTVTIPDSGNFPNAFLIDPNNMSNGTNPGVTNYMAMTKLISCTPAPANQPSGQLPVTTPDPGFPGTLQDGPFTGQYVPPVEEETEPQESEAEPGTE